MSDTHFPHVILVDQEDNEIGIAEKIEAHRLGLLHRAFSVFLYRHSDNGLELLLQQRHVQKYHSGGLWTNTCCSHPQPGLDLMTSAKNSLSHEVGLDCRLEEIGTFIYRAEFANEMTEHELDHVFIGHCPLSADEMKPHPEEIEALQWYSLTEIDVLMTENPEMFTAWFTPALAVFKNWAAQQQGHNQ